MAKKTDKADGLTQRFRGGGMSLFEEIDALLDIAEDAVLEEEAENKEKSTPKKEPRWIYG